MKAEQLALVQGWDDTRATLRRWNAAPLPVLGAWALGSLGVSVLLLAATWVVAELTTPDPTRYVYPGVNRPAELRDFVHVLQRNGLVLALHALACIAGFMAGSSLPRVAKGYDGAWRWVHEKAGPAAIAFVVGATLFSLVTQAYALGNSAASLAQRLGVTPLELIVTLLPHALPELCALFLPLAAWSLASRRGAWKELFAATLVTTAIAVPVLVLTAAIETWITPRLLLGLAG
jgi:hypothetical protein